MSSAKNNLFSGLGIFLSAAAVTVFLFFIAFFEPAPIVIIILFLCLSFFTFISPLSGFFLLILIRPLFDIFTDYPILQFGNFSLNFSSLLAVLAIIFALYISHKNHQHLKKIPAPLFIAAFIFFALVSTILSADFSLSVAEWPRILSIFSFYALGYTLITSTENLNKLLKVGILSAFIPGIVAFIQLFTHTGITIVTEEISNRIFGTFAHPNLFAYYLLIPLTLLLYLIANNSKSKLAAGLPIISGIFFLILLILTYTRGAWLAFLIIILIIGIFKYRRLLIIFFLISLVLYFSLSPIKSRIDNLITNDPGSSVQWRLSLWRDSLGYISNSLFLGHGTGTASEVILEKRGASFGSADPHNDYLKISLENGLLGLGAYLLIITALTYNLFKIYRSAPNQNLKNLALVFLGLTVALYIMSFADNIIRNTALQWTFWSLLGAFFSVNLSLQKKS